MDATWKETIMDETKRSRSEVLKDVMAALKRAHGLDKIESGDRAATYLIAAMLDLVHVLETLPESVEGHVAELRAPDLEYACTEPPREAGPVSMPYGLGWRLTKDFGDAFSTLVYWVREKPSSATPLLAAEEHIAVHGWPSRDRAVEYLARFAETCAFHDGPPPETPRVGEPTIEQRLGVLVERWLKGPPTFSPGSMAAGSATEDRSIERWATEMERGIAAFDHVELPVGARLLLVFLAAQVPKV